MPSADRSESADLAVWEEVDRSAFRDIRRAVTFACFVFMLIGVAVAGIAKWPTAPSAPEGSASSGGAQFPAPPPSGSMFDFSEAMRLGLDRGQSPQRLTVPACFGPVTRVAVVSGDLRSTAWEIVAIDLTAAPRVDQVALGVAPEGFSTVVPLSDVPPSALLVVNGPENLGLVAYDGSDSAVAPQPC